MVNVITVNVCLYFRNSKSMLIKEKKKKKKKCLKRFEFRYFEDSGDIFGNIDFIIVSF